MQDKLLEGAREVARALRDAGHEAFYAGGCVRDALLGIEPKDYDIVTDATPDRVDHLFGHTVMVGASFGVVRVRLRGKREYEVATYRTDGTYTDGRRPDEVVYSKSKEEDVHRRDFTINALLMDPVTHEILDFVGGRADLDARRIRAVGEAERRFAEDRLRMLRACRFAARFGFEIEAATLDAVSAHADSIRDVSVERIVGELSATWKSPRPGLGMSLLRDTGLLAPIFDFLDLSRSDEVLTRFDRLRAATAGLDDVARDAVAWAALITLDGESPDVDTILRRFKLSRELIRAATALVRLAPSLHRAESLSTAERVRIAVSPSFASTLALAVLILGDTHAAVARWRSTATELEANPLPAGPLVTGGDLKKLGLPPGPYFKDLLRAVEDEVFERRITNREAALAWAAATAKSLSR